jgi:hypothetical protein
MSVMTRKNVGYLGIGLVALLIWLLMYGDHFGEEEDAARKLEDSLNKAGVVPIIEQNPVNTPYTPAQ